MSVVVGNILRVAARMENNGVDDIINVMHFGVAAVPTPNNDAALLADISEHLSAAYNQIQGFLSNSMQSVDITVYNVSQDIPHGVTAWTTDFNGGSGSGEGMPPADCLLILVPTSVKRTVGRIYVSPLQESAQSGGIWNSTVRAAAEAFYVELVNATPWTNGAAFQYGVYKRSDGLLYQPASMRTQAQVAYQRRRKPGRGS